jgi:hypothetical protein
MIASKDLEGTADPTAPVGTPATGMNGTSLTKYDSTLNALGEAQRVEEVKDIRDQAVAMEEYARQAKNTELIERAVEVRLRAERRAGEMLAEMAERGERDNGKGNRNPGLKSHAGTPKLADLGITKSQSSRWQHLARLTPEEFERTVAHRKRKVLLAMGRSVKPIGARSCVRDDELAEPRKVRKAVAILCAAQTAQELAAGLAKAPNAFTSADLIRAITFLNELATALGVAEHTSRPS